MGDYLNISKIHSTKKKYLHLKSLGYTMVSYQVYFSKRRANSLNLDINYYYTVFLLNFFMCTDFKDL